MKIRTYYAQHLPEGEAVGAFLKSKMPEYLSAIDKEKEDPFWVMVTTSMYDDGKQAYDDANTTDSKSKSAVVAADLVPVASKMDERGRMLGSHETVVLKEEKVVSVPFKEWMCTKWVNESPNETAKRVLQQCVFSVNQQLRRRLPPVDLQRKKPTVAVVAAEDLKQGHLVIPLFVRRSTSIIFEGDYGDEHQKSIHVDLEWREANVNESMADLGIEAPIMRQVCLIVKDEVRFPHPDAKIEEWTGHEDLHPFWVIRRQKDGKAINCKIMKQMVESKTYMEWGELQKQGASIDGLGGHTVHIWYPFIVNTKDIRKGEEVVLEFHNEKEKR